MYARTALKILLAWVVFTAGMILLSGCAGMSDTKQRVVSGAAIGGTLACWPGAAVGAGIGWIVDEGTGRSPSEVEGRSPSEVEGQP